MWEPLTLKSAKKRIDGKKHYCRDEGEKPNDSSYRGTPNKFFLSPVDTPNPMSCSRWFQLVEIHCQNKCRVLRAMPLWTVNSQIRVVRPKTVIQAPREDFDLQGISELTGHANAESISSYSHIKPAGKNSGVCKISWPISTQARQLPTAIRVMLYERLF